jgi:hypothetical protein
MPPKATTANWDRGVNTIIEALNKKIDDLVKTVIDQSKRIADLEKKGGSTNKATSTEWRDVLIGKTKLTKGQSDILNVVGNEQKNRKNREDKVILFGVPASTGITDEDKIDDDKRAAAEILNSIYNHCGNAITKITRFKVKDTADNKPAPLRVEFGDVLYPPEIMKNAKKLRESSHKNVFVSLDLTQSQIVQLKEQIKTRNELNKKLDTENANKKTKATYRYGIRNNVLAKVMLKD